MPTSMMFRDVEAEMLHEQVMDHEGVLAKLDLDDDAILHEVRLVPPARWRFLLLSGLALNASQEPLVGRNPKRTTALPAIRVETALCRTRRSCRWVSRGAGPAFFCSRDRFVLHASASTLAITLGMSRLGRVLTYTYANMGAQLRARIDNDNPRFRNQSWRAVVLTHIRSDNHRAGLAGAILLALLPGWLAAQEPDVPAPGDHLAALMWADSAYGEVLDLLPEARGALRRDDFPAFDRLVDPYVNTMMLATIMQARGCWLRERSGEWSFYLSSSVLPLVRLTWTMARKYATATEAHLQRQVSIDNLWAHENQIRMVRDEPSSRPCGRRAGIGIAGGLAQPSVKAGRVQPAGRCECYATSVLPCSAQRPFLRVPGPFRVTYGSKDRPGSTISGSRGG